MLLLIAHIFAPIHLSRNIFGTRDGFIGELFVVVFITTLLIVETHNINGMRHINGCKKPATLSRSNRAARV